MNAKRVHLTKTTTEIHQQTSIHTTKQTNNQTHEHANNQANQAICKKETNTRETT